MDITAALVTGGEKQGILTANKESLKMVGGLSLLWVPSFLPSLNAGKDPKTTLGVKKKKQ